MIRLLGNKADIVGKGEHRSGWPWVMQTLEPILSADGILFDDFIERSFAFRPLKAPHREPWVGVFHQPHDAPEFLQIPGQSINRIIRSPLFRASLPELRLGITLSTPLAQWLQQELQVPFVSLIHPMETPALKFTREAFLVNTGKRIIQIGWYLRNTGGIYQLQAPDGYRKTRLLNELPWVKTYETLVAGFWRRYNWINEWQHRAVDRLPGGAVETVGRVSDEVYDRLLSENVVFVEFFATAANNAVVECIVRNTPLVVNRLPALEEYLGRDYPLFFDHIEEAPKLLETERILEGHAWLQAMDKRPFTGDYFRSQLVAALREQGLA